MELAHPACPGSLHGHCGVVVMRGRVAELVALLALAALILYAVWWDA